MRYKVKIVQLKTSSHAICAFSREHTFLRQMETIFVYFFNFFISWNVLLEQENEEFQGKRFYHSYKFPI